MVRLELPYPPSVNRYYRHVGPRTLISRMGRAYRRRVCAILRRAGIEPMIGDLTVGLDFYPPDRRRRDCDNPLKALLDALQRGGLYEDDSQIKKLLVVMRKTVVPGGKAVLCAIPFDPTTVKDIRHEITA